MGWVRVEWDCVAKGAHGLGSDGVVAESADEWKGKEKCTVNSLLFELFHLLCFLFIKFLEKQLQLW